MKAMDKWMLEDPTLVVISMVDRFKDQNYCKPQQSSQADAIDNIFNGFSRL